MLISFKEKSPAIAEETFIAENASIVGDVTIGKKSSVWYGAVIRGDFGSIEIGEGSNIQDCAVLHCDEGLPVKIGDNVTVGHGAIVHGATIASNVIIGMGSIVMNGATIGEDSVIGAGAVVTENMVVPAGSVAVGIPAKIAKNVPEFNHSMASLNAAEYAGLIPEYLKNN